MMAAEFPIDADVGNGATIADWLGTAATAARSAALHMDDVRTKAPRDVFSGKDPATTAREKLTKAEEYLRQALSELQTVRATDDILRRVAARKP
jgi:hypothetical protein